MRGIRTFGLAALALMVVLALGCEGDGGTAGDGAGGNPDTAGGGGDGAVTDTGVPGEDAHVMVDGMVMEDVPPQMDVPVKVDVPAGDDTVEPVTNACLNAADMAILADETVDPVAAAVACFGKCALEVPCLSDCIANGDVDVPVVGTGLSLDCASCYASNVGCGVTNCAMCLADSGSEECQTCLGEHCVPAFCECAGTGSTDSCPAAPAEDCDNTTDDDGDGDIDCADADCAGDPACPAVGACENAADLAILGDETVDVTGTARDCALRLCGAEDLPCLGDCIVNGNVDLDITGTGLTLDCAGCYGGSTACGINNCLAECVVDSTSAECVACLVEHCVPTFCACAGEQASENCTAAAK